MTGPRRGFFNSSSLHQALDFEGRSLVDTAFNVQLQHPKQPPPTNNQTKQGKMGRGRYTEDSASYYPGSSHVDWSGSSSRGYSTVQYSPSDSSGMDPTSFRRNAFSFDRQSGPQPRDYRHYDVHGGTYAGRDSGYSQRATNGDYGYGFSSGGASALARDAERMRMGGSSSSRSRYASDASSHFDSERVHLSRRGSGGARFDSMSSTTSGRSRSRFADFLSGSSSGRSSRTRDHSSPSSRSSSSRFFGPDDVGRGSLSSSRRPSFSGSGYGGRYETSSRPSYSGRGYGGSFDSDGGYGSSGGYRTEIITPGGGGYSRSGNSSRRRQGRFEID